MGAVFEAWQRSLQRVVAVKVLGQHISASPKSIQRFQREAHAAAKLHHTHIVPIFAQGDEGGVYFYAMELIEGPSLNTIIAAARRQADVSDIDGDADETVALGRSTVAVEMPADGAETQPITPDVSCASEATVSLVHLPADHTSHEHFMTVARHIAGVADALDYAHEQGVVHRDIKPHNLILGRDDRMRISDFGLARVSEQPGMTVTGELIGSPLYMSPEQITEGPSRVDSRTDIYSLGATMYEWLVLRPPHPGETRERVIANILRSEPRSLRALNPEVPIDLETICLKALERDRERRYRSAGELRDDLRRFLDSRPIKAKRVGLPTRLGKFIARHQVGTLATVAATIAVLLGSALYFAQREVKQKRLEAESQAAAAQQAREVAAAAEQALQESENLFDVFSAMLPLEIELPRRAVQAARPYVEDILETQQNVPNPTDVVDAQGANSALVGTPEGIAQRATSDLYQAFAPKYWPSSPFEYECSYALLGGIDLNAPDLGKARQVVDQCLLSRPDHLDARTLHAALSGRMRQYDTMASDAYVLIRRRTEEATGYLWLGLAHLLLGDMQQSMEDLDTALANAGRDDGRRMWARTLRGLALLRLSRANEALLEFNEALALAPNTVIVLLGRSCAIASLGDSAGAIADLARVIKQEPGNASALALRGEYYVKLGNYEAAIDDFDQAKSIAGGLYPATIASYLSAYRQRSLANTAKEQAEDKDDAADPAEIDQSSSLRVFDRLRGPIGLREQSADSVGTA